MLKKIRNALVGWLGAGLIRLVAPTLRLKVEDDSGLISNPADPQPVVFAFWHNRMFLMPYLYRRLLPGRRVACLVSASQDGEMIARVLERWGLEAVRGSSSRRGKEAFRELAETLRGGADVAITPDGPRGPCYEAHVGVVGLAALSGCRLIPVNYDLSSKIQLRSWDRFMIPLPFGRCRLRLGRPMNCRGMSSDEDLEKGRAELQRQLCGMSSAATAENC